jgi:hypothetical protein
MQLSTEPDRDDARAMAARPASPLREFRDTGYRLLGISWRPEVAKEKPSEDEIKAMCARECFARRLGFAFRDMVDLATRRS